MNAQEREPVLFEKLILKITKSVILQKDLTSRCYSRSIRIADTQRVDDSIEGNKEKVDPNSIIGILNSIVDEIDENNKILQYVAEDLENSIM